MLSAVQEYIKDYLSLPDGAPVWVDGMVRAICGIVDELGLGAPGVARVFEGEKSGSQQGDEFAHRASFPVSACRSAVSRARSFTSSPPRWGRLPTPDAGYGSTRRARSPTRRA